MTEQDEHSAAATAAHLEQLDYQQRADILNPFLFTVLELERIIASCTNNLDRVFFST